jgi:DNA end-binding protein Ku
LLDLAETLIAKKTAPFDASKFHDRYIEALQDLIERKRKGKTIHTEEESSAPAKGMNVVDLMAALKRSVEKPGSTANDDDAKPARKSAAKPAAAKKPPAKKAAPAKAPAKKRAAG